MSYLGNALVKESSKALDEIGSLREQIRLLNEKLLLSESDLNRAQEEINFAWADCGGASFACDACSVCVDREKHKVAVITARCEAMAAIVKAAQDLRQMQSSEEDHDKMRMLRKTEELDGAITNLKLFEIELSLNKD